MNYLDRFKNMVDEIENHPFLEVVKYQTFPPAKAEVFKKAAELIGAELDATILNFFSETNGLHLHWKVKEGIPETVFEELVENCDDYWMERTEHPDNPFAKINILPLEKSILYNWDQEIPSEGFEETTRFGKLEMPSTQFIQNLKSFDLFSEYSCMAFFLSQGQGNPSVLWLSDNYADWENSKLTDFYSYLETLLVTRGICDSRETVFEQEDGHRKAPLSRESEFWKKPKFIPKLFIEKNYKKLSS